MKTTLTKIAAVTGALALVAVYVLMQSGKRWFDEVAPPPPKPADPPRIASDASRDLTPPIDPKSGPVFAQPTPLKTPAPSAPTAAAEMPPIELPVQVAPQSKPLDPRLLPATSNAPTNIVAPNPLAPITGTTTTAGSSPLASPITTTPLALPAAATATMPPSPAPYNVPKIQSGPLTISTQPTTNSGLALPQIGPGAHTSSQPSPFVKTQTLVIPGSTPAPQLPTGPQMQPATGGPRIVAPQSPILPGSPTPGPGSPLGLPK